MTTGAREPDPGAEPRVAAAVFRRASRQFATGVTVATAADGDLVHAITATAFCPLSLDPPLVLLALSGDGVLLRLVRNSGNFGVSILSAQQQQIAEWASRHGRVPGATLPGVDAFTEVTGAPVLRGSVAWFDCVLDQEHVHGDHALLVGRVVAAGADESLEPLAYLRGGYREIVERTD